LNLQRFFQHVLEAFPESGEALKQMLSGLGEIGA